MDASRTRGQPGSAEGVATRRRKPGARTGGRNEVIWSRAGFLARRLHHIYVSIFLEELERSGVTPIQWGVMMVVAGAPRLGHTEIAEQLGLDRSNVANVVARLAGRKLLREEKSSVDRRKREVSLTPAGKQLLGAFEPRVKKTNDRLLAPLTTSERDVFMSLLRRIVDGNNGFSRVPLSAEQLGFK